MRIHISYKRFEFCPRATAFSWITAHLGWLIRTITFIIGIGLLAWLFDSFRVDDILQYISYLIEYVVLLHIVVVLYPACTDTYTDLIFLKYKSGGKKTPEYKALRRAWLLDLGEFLKENAIKFYSTAICVLLGLGGLILVFAKGIRKAIPFSPSAITTVGIIIVILAIVFIVLLKALFRRLFDENKEE